MAAGRHLRGDGRLVSNIALIAGVDGGGARTVLLAGSAGLVGEPMALGEYTSVGLVNGRSPRSRQGAGRAARDPGRAVEWPRCGRGRRAEEVARQLAK